LPGEAASPAERLPSDELRVVYAGTLGQGYDVDGIVAAAAILGERKVPVHIVVAGDGPSRAKVETAARANPNLVYVGRVSAADLGGLYRDADVGLCAYVPGSTVAMPCKVYDYLAAGLAVVSSLDGELAELLREQRIGLRYRPDFAWRGVGLGTAGRMAGWTFGMLLLTTLAGIVQTLVLGTASGSGNASVAAVDYAWLIFMLPHSVITVSIATASLPPSLPVSVPVSVPTGESLPTTSFVVASFPPESVFALSSPPHAVNTTAQRDAEAIARNAR